MEWIKFDLHHHTGEDKDRKENDFNYEEILLKFFKNDFKLISITNHNIISINSIKKYQKIIETKNLDIKILPGIETEFKMRGAKKSGHLIFIFPEMNLKKIEKLSNFFKNSENYDPKSEKDFSEKFPNLVNKLINFEFRDFVIMPHFAKNSNKIDYETIFDDNDKKNNLKPWLHSFDILEGNILNKEVVKSIEKSFEKSNFEYDKAIYIGTDGHNTKTTLENIEKITYVLTEPSYEGLINMIHFPKTRISKEKEKPAILENYIKKIKINDMEINLSQGLNTIIGRRGSGKSYLLNSIINELKPSFNIGKDKEFDKEIELIENKTLDKNKILVFKQSQIADSLTNFIYDVAKEKNKDFNLIKKIFGKDFDRTNFTDSILYFQNEQQNIKNNFKEILNYSLEKEKNNSKKTIENYKSNIYHKFLKLLEKEKQKPINSIIKKDLEIIKSLLDDSSNNKTSEWLKNELKKIKLKLDKLKEIYEHQKLEKIVDLEIKVNDVIGKLNFSSIDSNINENLENSIKKLKNNKLKEKFSEFKKFIINIKKFVDLTNNNKNFIDEDIKVANNNQEYSDFLTFDRLISKIVFEYENVNELISGFIKFNLNYKDGEYIKKKKYSTDENIRDTMVEIKTIPKVNKKDITKFSVGQQHEIFIKNILKINDADIIILDQPDDDLDALTINETLLSKFREHFYLKQWIIVTHNPEIVINSDSRKIILSNYGGSFSGHKIYSNINSRDIRDKKIYKILDSSKEYPKIRGIRYEN